MYNFVQNIMKILSRRYVKVPTYFDKTKIYIGFGVQKKRTRLYRYRQGTAKCFFENTLSNYVAKGYKV